MPIIDGTIEAVLAGALLRGSENGTILAEDMNVVCAKFEEAMTLVGILSLMAQEGKVAIRVCDDSQQTLEFGEDGDWKTLAEAVAHCRET